MPAAARGIGQGDVVMAFGPVDSAVDHAAPPRVQVFALVTSACGLRSDLIAGSTATTMNQDRAAIFIRALLPARLPLDVTVRYSNIPKSPGPCGTPPTTD
ncbi:hypothetical protein ACH4SK_39510 [Streptomyces inhibens]|uniref:hypothetical protein n=1 Tax=Streptomyces inhibens TaxID=2293571 RepID=UPI0037AE7511